MNGGTHSARPLTLDEWEPREKSELRRRLLRWFDANQRDLPWRKRKSPYRTWVSEIMLQQTQVNTVVDYFNRFVKRFPSIQSLAQADLQHVLQMWEGLGYYRRARQLHAAAREVVENHQGKFPERMTDVLALPGIGRYTAGAILSIALDQPHPILEGNTLRLFARLTHLREDIKSSAVQKRLWAFSESLVSRHRPGDLNQALMELGSLVCTVRKPACVKCPIKSFCHVRLEGEPSEIPVPSARKTNYEELHEAAIVIRRRDKVLLRKCRPGERWEHLWDFLRFALPPTGQADFLVQSVFDMTGLHLRLGSPYARMKHAVTKYRIRLDCYLASDVTGRISGADQEVEWVPISDLADRPLSVTGRKIAKSLTS